MIKHILNKIIIAVVFLTILSCAKEKKETQSKKEHPVEITDSVATPVTPTVTAPITTHKDTIAKHSPVSDPKATGCDMLHKGTFTYKDPEGDPVLVKIVDNVITEEHKNGKFMLMSQMTWKGECEYDNMLIVSTVPAVQLEPGTVMNVVIDKVDGNDIYFTATAKGKSYHNVLTKVK